MYKGRNSPLATLSAITVDARAGGGATSPAPYGSNTESIAYGNTSVLVYYVTLVCRFPRGLEEIACANVHTHHIDARDERADSPSSKVVVTMLAHHREPVTCCAPSHNVRSKVS